MGKRLIITVDGPAGSGKSTVSRILAERISYVYLDTGLLYRAVAYRAMQRGISIEDDTALRKLCDAINIPFELIVAPELFNNGFLKLIYPPYRGVSGKSVSY